MPISRFCFVQLVALVRDVLSLCGVVYSSALSFSFACLAQWLSTFFVEFVQNPNPKLKKNPKPGCLHRASMDFSFCLLGFRPGSSGVAAMFWFNYGGPGRAWVPGSL